jgi:transcriptional regulator with XRE-family HTH domain
MKKKFKNKNTIGQRIKKLRLSKEWSQMELAKKINSDNRQVSRYEHDKIFPAGETLVKLAKAFSVTIDYLAMGELSGEANERLKDKELLELFEQVEHFKKNDKEAVKNFIDALSVRNKVETLKLNK